LRKEKDCQDYQMTTLSPNQRMQPTTYGAMAITDRTRKFLWGRSGNRCAIGNNELVVDATPDDDKSIIARMSATSSRHAPKVHAADANIGVCYDVRDPELAQPTRNAESAWACFVAELHAWIPSVRLTKSRQELFDSMEIVADGSIEPHFPASPALSYRDDN
jgi:hypothetical protein